VLPVTALDRIRWDARVAYEDQKENGTVVERRGVTQMTGRLFWRGQFVGSPIKLVFSWVFTLDPKTEKYFLTDARLEDESSHELVDEKGGPIPFPSVLFALRHALGRKSPVVQPEPLRKQINAVRHAGHFYRLAASYDFIEEVDAVKRSRHPNVELELRPDDYSDDIVHLANFRVKDPEERRSGVGSDVMRWLSALADNHNVTIKLHVEPYGEEAPTRAQVKHFYRGFGFRDKPQNWMVRRPQRDREGMINPSLFADGDDAVILSE
jgi:ribosomal protein S18 acetylase RimI-like enzyme